MQGFCSSSACKQNLQDDVRHVFSKATQEDMLKSVTCTWLRLFCSGPPMSRLLGIVTRQILPDL